MTDYRSEAEKFVTEFLDYIQEVDILDHLDKRTNKMVRSPGVEKLIRSAKAVFPARADNGKVETDKLDPAAMNEAIITTSNVIDTREMFARKVQKNGGVRSLLRSLYRDEPGAADAVAEFLAAEDGEKEFRVDDKK
jgi:hypothetical protein